MKTRLALASASIAALIAAGGVSYGLSDPGSLAPGPLSSILGAIVLGHVPNNTALVTLPSRLRRVRRDGYATAGDGGMVEYTLGPCPSGVTPDGGSLVQLNDGGCAIADFGDKPPSIKIWGAQNDSNGTPGNGTDDTTPIQNAANWANPLSRKLYFPGGTGKYRTTSRLNLPGNGTLMGDGADPGSVTGSWLFFDHTDYGLLSAGTWHYDGIGTMRAQPAPSSTAGTAYTPCACNYDIESVQGELYIHDVFTLNPTKQLEVQAGRLVLDGLRGQPLSVGIQLDSNLDTVSIHRHRSWPYWSTNSNVTDYTHKSLVAMNFGRVDSPEVSDTFEFAAATCLQFYTSTAAPQGGVTTRGNFVNFGCDDYGVNGITFLGASDVSASFSNAYVFPMTNVTGYGVSVDSNSPRVNLVFTNFHMSNPYESFGNSAFNVSATGDIITAIGLQIDGWGGPPGTPAINVAKGSFFYLNDFTPNITACYHGQTSGCQSTTSPWFGGTAYTAQSQGLIPLPTGNGLLTISSGTNGPDAVFLLAAGTVTPVTIPSGSPFVAIASGNTTATQENATNTPSNKISVGYYTDAATPGYFVYNNGGPVNLTYRLFALGQNN